MTKLNPTEARAGADKVLTHLALGYRPSKNYVGLQVAPAVSVPERGGLVLEFDDSCFLEEDDLRADGAAYREINRGYEGVPFSIRQHGYIYKAGEAEYEESARRGINQSTIAVDELTKKSNLMVERQIADMVFNPNNYIADRKQVVSAGSYWGGDGANSVDPYNAILYARRLISQSIGSDPTHMVVGREVWDAIITNEKLLAHYSQTSHAAITKKVLAERYGLEEILVGGATSKKTTTENNTFMWGNFAALFYRSSKIVSGQLGLAASNAYSRQDPSSFYTYVYQNHPKVSGQWYERQNGSYCWKIDYDRQPVMPMPQSAFLFINPVKL